MPPFGVVGNISHERKEYDIVQDLQCLLNRSETQFRSRQMILPREVLQGIQEALVTTSQLKTTSKGCLRRLVDESLKYSAAVMLRQFPLLLKSQETIPGGKAVPLGSVVSAIQRAIVCLERLQRTLTEDKEMERALQEILVDDDDLRKLRISHWHSDLCFELVGDSVTSTGSSTSSGVPDIRVIITPIVLLKRSDILGNGGSTNGTSWMEHTTKDLQPSARLQEFLKIASAVTSSVQVSRHEEVSAHVRCGSASGQAVVTVKIDLQGQTGGSIWKSGERSPDHYLSFRIVEVRA